MIGERSDSPGERAGLAAPEVDQIDFRRLAELSADPIAVHAGDVIVWANAAAAALVGAPGPGSLVGTSVSGFVAPEYREAMIRRAQLLACPGATVAATEEDFVRLDGSRVRVETSGAALGGGLTLVVVRDVSRRAEAERAQRAAETRLRAFFEVATDGIGIARASDGAHVMVNAAHARMFGFERPEDELGAQAISLIAPSERGRVGALSAPLEAGGGSVEVVTRGLRRDGSEFDLQVNVTAFSDGEERLVAAMLRDVTDRRRAEEERAALQDRLRQAEKLEALGRLAGGIAHDFNNILSGILGYAELTLLATPAGSEPHDHQERIREAALRARALVRQILAFSRLDRAAQHLVDVPSVVSEALGLVRAGIPATVALDPRIDPAAGATVADPTQIHQIVLNLCANARAAVGDYGHVEVAVEGVDLAAPLADVAPGRYVRLRVRDDGVGMEAATRARLFEPYMTTRGRFGGHGLGLAVVHGIVTSAGGTIQVETAPGRGSTFDVYLPRRDGPRPEAATAPALPAGRGERVLLVDDEPMVRGSHRRLLESLGYAVELASDGEEAIARLRDDAEGYDLVLTDQTMPRRSGIDLAAAVTALRPALPVILCTGHSDRVGPEGARPPGVSEVLEKPIERAMLARVVRRVLDAGTA